MFIRKAKYELLIEEISKAKQDAIFYQEKWMNSLKLESPLSFSNEFTPSNLSFITEQTNKLKKTKIENENIKQASKIIPIIEKAIKEEALKGRDSLVLNTIVGKALKGIDADDEAISSIIAKKLEAKGFDIKRICVDSHCSIWAFHVSW